MNWKRLLGLLAVVVVFVIVNRGAFEGYFSDDDLDNLSWSTVAGSDTLPPVLVSPQFSETNTRPVGAYFYRWAGWAYGLQFERYLPWLFAFHLLNGVLLWVLLRRKGCAEAGAWAGALFFVFHAALLEAWWKPMFVFDLLCGSFLLLSWLTFQRLWPLAWVAFWLAYKAKEVALFFPVVLLLDAVFLQQGRGWQVIPFLLTSLSFGVQALLVNRTREMNYTLRFGLEPLLVCAKYYFHQIGLTKYGAFLLAPAAYFAREKQVWIGIAGCIALLVPLLVLPTRLFSVYLYVPMLPLAVGIGFAAAKAPKWAVSAVMLVWLGWNFQVLREKRKVELALAHETRAYVEQVQSAHKAKPLGDTVFYENAPAGLRMHGVRGALRLITANPGIAVLDPEMGAQRALARGKDLPTLFWFRPTQKLEVVYHRDGEARLMYVEFAVPASVWQLGDGWYGNDGGYRWTAKESALYLQAQPDSRVFQVRYNIGGQLIRAVGKVGVKLYLNEDLVGESEFSEAGIPVVGYPLKKSYQGDTKVRIVVSPGYKPPSDARTLGVAIWGLGFVL